MNLERTPTIVVSYPAWLRGWSALTAAAVFALVAIGTFVTTFHVGMADKLWPTAPWHILLSERVPSFGYYVEHSHRIAGFLVGTFILIQTVMLWTYSPSPWRSLGAIVAVFTTAFGTGLGMLLVKQSGERSTAALLNPGFFLAAALALAFLLLAGAEIASGSAGRWHRAFAVVAYIGVIVQGMLGGLRVYLNEVNGPELAVIHGVFAQVLFASACLLALMTGRRWNTLFDLDADPLLRRLTAATLALLFVQIAFGGLLRHLYHPLAQRLHPLLAFAALVLIIWTVAQAGHLRSKAWALLAMVGVQAALGIEAWIRTADPATRFASVEIPEAGIRSMHVLTGFGIFASAALLAARAWKAKLI